MRGSIHSLPRVFRHRSLVCALLALATLPLAHPVHSDEPLPGKLKGFARVQGNLGQISVFSDDKLVMTLMFDNFVTELADNSQRLVVTQSQTFLIPIQSASQNETRLALQLRGFISMFGNARAALTVQAGGKTRVVDLEEAVLKAQRNQQLREMMSPTQPTDPPSPVTAEQRAQARATAKRQVPAPFQMVAEDFIFEMDFRVPPDSKNPITISVLVERDFDTAEHQGHLMIDSFDLSITDPIQLTTTSAPPPF